MFEWLFKLQPKLELNSLYIALLRISFTALNWPTSVFVFTIVKYRVYTSVDCTVSVPYYPHIPKLNYIN